jgi:hypothetical protein
MLQFNIVGYIAIGGNALERLALREERRMGERGDLEVRHIKQRVGI